jgi:hypothetical protein
LVDASPVWWVGKEWKQGFFNRSDNTCRASENTFFEVRILLKSDNTCGASENTFEVIILAGQVRILLKSDNTCGASDKGLKKSLFLSESVLACGFRSHILPSNE